MKKIWARIKKWFTSVLILLGLVAAPFVVAQVTGFSYTPATEYTTGEPMPLSDIEFTRLYCNGSMVSEEVGADSDFSVDLAPGSYDCYATHVAGGAESAPSNTVTKVITLGPPNPPELLQ